MTQTVIEPTSSEQSLGRARKLLQDGQMPAAAQLCEDVLRAEPENRDALYTLAVVRRFQRDLPGALALADQLIAADPSNGRAHQERGHCLRDMGDTPGAFAAYQNAVAHNAALAGSWNMLAKIHTAAGRTEPAEFAETQRDYLTNLPPELQTVASLIQEGRYLKAEKICRGYLQRNGHHVEGMRLLAELGTKFSVLDEAEFLLESALVLEPDNAGAHFDYVEVLHKRQKFAQALEQASLLRAKEPDSPQIEMLYANENLSVGNFDEALKVYGLLAKETPNNPGIHLTIGHALKTVGRQPEAIEAYTRAYRVKPDFGDAYWSLANLKTYKFDDAQLAAMRAQEAAPSTQLVDRYHLCFALGKALEDRGDYAASFAYYERGNQIGRAHV